MSDIPLEDRLTPFRRDEPMPDFTDISEEKRASLPSTIDPKIITSIRAGRTLPTPAAFLTYQDAYDAVLSLIENADKEKKIELIGAVEAYIKSFEKKESDIKKQMNEILEKIAIATYPVAIAGGALSYPLTGQIDGVTAAVFFVLLVIMLVVAPQAVRDAKRSSDAAAEELKRRLLRAMRPRGL